MSMAKLLSSQEAYSAILQRILAAVSNQLIHILSGCILHEGQLPYAKLPAVDFCKSGFLLAQYLLLRETTISRLSCCMQQIH